MANIQKKGSMKNTIKLFLIILPTFFSSVSGKSLFFFMSNYYVYKKQFSLNMIRLLLTRSK